MRRRRTATAERPPELIEAFRAFQETIRRVEEARGSLLAVVPGARRSGAPLADALAGFEDGLDSASSLMRGWRVEALLPEWEGCASALQDCAAGAERLRLHAMPEGYEQLYGTLADLIEPLEAFAEALAVFRRLGLR